MLFRQFSAPVLTHRWGRDPATEELTCEACGFVLTPKQLLMAPEPQRLAIPTCPGKRPEESASEANADTDQT